MAHEIMMNDTMMSVREKPWHYAETADRVRIIQEAPTSLDALRAAGLNWEVLQSPIYMEGGKIIDGRKVNYRNGIDGPIVLGDVSDRYKIVQNTDAFAFTDTLISGAASDVEVRYETAGSLQNGKKVWLLARLPDTNVIGDKYEWYLCFTNSHDGKGAVQVCITNVRVVCANTLNQALNGAKRSWSTRHTGDMFAKIAEARNCLAMSSKYITSFTEDADRLANKRLYKEQFDEILAELFPVDEKDSDRKKRNVATMKDAAIRCYMMPDIAQFRDTAYGALNAISDFVCHKEAQRMTDSYAENRWEKIMGGDPIYDKAYELICAAANA